MLVTTDTVPPPPPPSERQRPSFETIAMNTAVNLSQRSTCKRPIAGGYGVGCVIFSLDFQRMLAWGYNGNARGLKNGCDSDEPGKCGCIHAEQNAIIKCREPAETPKIVICTHLPCMMCSKFIINLGGVAKVLYLNDYRIRDSLQVLRDSGITIEQFMPESR